MSSNAPTPDERITIELSSEESLVLFEFLSRFSNDHKLEIHDQAEERVLWNMCCDLEKTLVEPFRPDYADLLQKARDAVRDNED